MVFSSNRQGTRQMADAQPNQDFTQIAYDCRHAQDAALKDLLKKNEGVIKAANLRERKIARVGMPWGNQIDSWSDEIPIVCGAKKFVQWFGGGAGLALGAWKIKQIFFG